MKLRLRLLSTAAAATMALHMASSSVQAADIVEPVAAYDWSGLYIGGHVGYGAAYMKGCQECDVSGSTLDAEDLDLDGILGGGHLGYNFQSDALVFGIEGDFSWTDFKDSHTESDEEIGKVEFLASVRARLGYAMDNVLVYATGGVAFTDATFETKQHGNDDEVDFKDIGGVVGAGVEYGISESFSLRAEGLYYFFGEEQDISDFHSSSEGEEIELDDAFAVRVGASFHF